MKYFDIAISTQAKMTEMTEELPFDLSSENAFLESCGPF